VNNVARGDHYPQLDMFLKLFANPKYTNFTKEEERKKELEDFHL
jgi:hypothetical protein